MAQPGMTDSLHSPGGTPNASGHVIENLASGERIVIRQTAEETGGALFSFDLVLPPRKHVPAWHAHPIQEERFTIVQGRMRFRLGFRTVLAGQGDTVVVPPKVAHWFGNAGPGTVAAFVEVRPALQMQEFFEHNAELHKDGATSWRPGALARLLLAFSREVAIPILPGWLTRPVLQFLARGQGPDVKAI
jgi:quercetin dioxygenase-like cupin family protein